MGKQVGERESLTGTRFTFQDIFQGMASAWRFEEMLDCILAVALRELEAQEGSLLLTTSDDTADLKMLAARGVPDEIRKRGYVRRAGSISERVLNERRPLIINGTLEPEKIGDAAAGLMPRRIRSALCVPLIAQGRVLGTMNINRTAQESKEFSEHDLRVAQVIASQAAMVIENHRLHEELAQRERLAAIGQVVAGIAHCVKNMLAGVHGGLGLIRMGLSNQNSELVEKGVAILHRSLALLSNLIMDLLDISKDRRPIRQPFRVADMLGAIGDILGHKASNLGVVLEIQCEDEECEFYGDRDQITRAIINLALNAIEACAEKAYAGGEFPRVRITARRAPAHEFPLPAEESGHMTGWMIFEVEDNGPGIPPEAVPHLWDFFFSTKGSKGTGIGLPAARKVVSEHGGKILLSTQQGVGTTFTVVLPCVEARRAQD